MPKFIPGDIITDGVKTIHIYRVSQHTIEGFDLTQEGPFLISFSGSYRFPGYKLVRHQQIRHLHDLLFLSLLQEGR